MSSQIPTSLHLVIEPNAIVPLSTAFSIRGLDPNTDPENKPQINFIIGRGNVFHPEAHIVLDASHVSSSALQTLEFRIGENNLFEECSTVTFHLNESNTLLMGSYNLIAARSHLETSRIGNGNIFQPLCHIEISSIKNGNIFSPLCTLTMKNSDQSIQETVFYVVRKAGDMLPPSCQFREHKYGTKKNIAEVGLLLGVVKNIIQANHPIMMA